MKKKWLMLFSIISLTFLLSSCEEYISPIMFQVSDSEKFPSKFPATVDIDYYISNSTKNLYGEDKYIVFKWGNHGKFNYHTAYPVKKTADGYIIIGSAHEDYAIPNPEEFGYSQVYQMKEKNGTFSILFEKEYRLRDFLGEHMSGLDDVCAYYKCLPDKNE